MMYFRKFVFTWPLLLASAVAVAAFGGCSAIYRETRYVYRVADQQAWRQIDTLNEFGQFTLECSRGGVTVQMAGQIRREYYPEKIGPPLVPMAKANHAVDDSTSKLFVRLTIASPHDSCVIDLRQISLCVANDSVVHPTNYLTPIYIVHDTTRTLGLEFRGALFTSATVRLELGPFRVGSQDVEWPTLTFEKESNTHYTPLGFPTN